MVIHLTFQLSGLVFGWVLNIMILWLVFQTANGRMVIFLALHGTLVINSLSKYGHHDDWKPGCALICNIVQQK
jgi:hypothetical protein